MPAATRWIVVAATAAGLTLRLLHLRAVVPYELGQPPPPSMDRWLAMQVAGTIAAGDWTGGWAAPYDSSPAYSYLLATLYRLGGERWLVPLLVQALLGAAVPALLYGAARRVAGWRAGILAALLGALYAPAIFYEGLLVKFSVIPFVTASFLFALVHVADGNLGWPLLTGLALGTLALLRPNAALALPVALAWAAGAPLAVGGRRVAVLLAGAALALVPMAARDHLAARRGLGSALGGIHFYIGTNPDADGEYVVLPGIRPDIVGHVADAQRVAEERAGRKLTPDEVSRAWWQEGLRFIRDRPGRYALLEIRKLWFALEAGEGGSFGDDFDEFQEMSPILRLPAVTFGTVAPLGLVGLLWCTRRRAWIVPLVVATLLVSLLPFFVAGRYRLPLAMPMIVLAAIGLVQLDCWRRAGRRATLAAAGAALVAVAIVLDASDAQVLGLLAAGGLGLLILAVAPPEPQSCT